MTSPVCTHTKHGKRSHRALYWGNGERCVWRMRGPLYSPPWGKHWWGSGSRLALPQTLNYGLAAYKSYAYPVLRSPRYKQTP